MNPDHAFIRRSTILTTAALIPEIRLHLATEITPIWQATEAFLTETGLAPPYWAFAWPGSIALARHLLDNPALVRGKRVIDFAAGSGLAAIAAFQAGARTVTAIEIDPMAAAAIALNAAENHAHLTIQLGDATTTTQAADLILCGDICYEAPMTRHIWPWLQSCAQTTEVWIADPGRAYVPTKDLEEFADYTIPTTAELESRSHRHTRLYRLKPPPQP